MAWVSAQALVAARPTQADPGAVSSNVYVADDAPWFTLGHGLVLMYITMYATFGQLESTED